MTATVTQQLEVALPADICEELGIEPGARLDFSAKNGKLEAVKLPPLAATSSERSLSHLYSDERNAEELIIQKGCSCEVPDDFPR